MKKIIAFGLAFTICNSFSNAQQNDKYERDLQKLREANQEAIERVLEPVRKRHIHNLETLLKRATFDGDLNTAVKVKKELDRLKDGETHSKSATSPFVGQWEYDYKGKTYRRFILADGSVELWKAGSIWKKSSGEPYWKGFSWKPIGGNQIEIQNDRGELYLMWELSGNDEVLQTEIASGKKETFKRGKGDWK